MEVHISSTLPKREMLNVCSNLLTHLFLLSVELLLIIKTRILQFNLELHLTSIN